MKKFIAKTSHANGKNYNKTTYKVMIFDYCMWFWNIHMVQPPSPLPVGTFTFICKYRHIFKKLSRY